MSKHCMRVASWILALVVLSTPAFGASTDASEKPFEPIVGQEGKDVVWVPSPQATVEKMLDLAKVTPKDFVIDLGSGDGRNVIAAAKRGARALGVEYNEKMVEFSRRAADKEGVGERATFLQGDMYEADISEATVLALFLLPDNLNKLLPKFLALKPGSRIVANHFGIKDWKPDVVERQEKDCEPWCTALLYIVPANVAGAWRLGEGQLKLEQQFQEVSGSLVAAGAEKAVTGKLQGDLITLKVGDSEYTGRVNGNTMAGDAWRAVRNAN